MDPQYIREYYHIERNHWWFRVRRRILEQTLEALLGGRERPLRILNVGACTGHTSEFLQAFGPVTSVEYELELADFLRQELRMEVVSASITELPFPDSSFDLVCALDVLEHVQDDRQGARELMRVCRPAGMVVVTVPAFASLWSHHDEVNHHFRRYRSGQLGGLFSDPGARLIRATYFNTLLFGPIWLFRSLSRLLGLGGRGQNSSGSDFEAMSAWSPLLYALFSLELPLLRRWDFPFGVSLLHCYGKLASGVGD